MDYVFFAFSALCIGFAALLTALAVTGRDSKLPLRYLLLAAAVSFAYYLLEISVFRNNQVLYYVGNLLPQLLLLVSLIVYLRRQGRS